MRITVPRLAAATTVVMAAVLAGLAIHARGGQTYATGGIPVVTVTDPATLTTRADTDGVLMPGGRADLVIAVQNDGPSTLVLRAVSQAGQASLVDGGCSVDTSMITVFDLHRLAMPVPVGASEIRLANAVYMGQHTDDACTGGVFRIPVLITVTG